MDKKPSPSTSSTSAGAEKSAPKEAVKGPVTCKFCHTISGDGTDTCADHKE